MRTVRRLGIALAAASALLTSACAAGRHAQTDQERATIDGTYTSVGAIDLRGLAIASPTGGKPYYPSGGAAQVKIVIVNSASGTSAKSDRLVGVSSPAASGWAAYATDADAQAAIAAATGTSAAAPAVPASTPAATAHSSAPASAGESIASGASSTATASATAPAGAPKPLTAISIAPGQRVSFGTPEASGALLLLGLKQKLYPGSTIPMTFTFADAGSVTVAVPVQISTSPPASVLPVPSASAPA